MMAGWPRAVRFMPEPKHFEFIRTRHYNLPEIVLLKAFSPEISSVFLPQFAVKKQHKIAFERESPWNSSPSHMSAHFLPPKTSKWKSHKLKWALSYKGCSIWACYLYLANIGKMRVLLSNPRESGIWQFLLVNICKATEAHMQALARLSCLSGLLPPEIKSMHSWMMILEKTIQNPNCREPGDSEEGTCLHLYPTYVSCESCGLRSIHQAVMADPSLLRVMNVYESLAPLEDLRWGWGEWTPNYLGLAWRLSMASVHLGRNACIYFKEDFFLGT